MTITLTTSKEPTMTITLTLATPLPADGTPCVLNHGGNYAVISCDDRPATHFVQYPSWKKPLPSCSAFAYEALADGATVIAFDAIKHAATYGITTAAVTKLDG